MARADPSDSEAEESENSTSEEEETKEPSSNGRKQHQISDYEKQRLSRIAQNKARMEAMGLAKMASSLMGSPQNSCKRNGKRKIVEDDEDYRPNDVDDGGGDDGDLDDDDDEVVGNKLSRSRKRKVKNKSSTPKKKAPIQRQLSASDYIDNDDDDELLQAIALSLQHSPEIAGPTSDERKENARIQEVTGRGKKKKTFTSRVQMTEDEVVLNFLQFDEAGKGHINLGDLQRLATAHDFTWTDYELADMIHCFDSDGDRKINLDDFQRIVRRCNMVRVSESA